MKKIVSEIGEVITDSLPVIAIILLVIGMISSHGYVNQFIKSFETSICG